MPSDAALTPGHSAEMARSIGNGLSLDRIDTATSHKTSLCSTLLRELRFANADYRMLALHAGPSHSITLDAKQRAARIAALLREETERMRNEKAEPLP